MAFNTKFGTEDVSPYLVHSRREVISLLRAMLDRNQLVSMQADSGADAVVTSVLELDEEADLVVIDRAPSRLVNQRILDSDNVSFETVLDNIRIMFFTEKIAECLYDGMPALCTAIPKSMVRLQRREHYRVPTPVAKPVRCTITVPPEHKDGAPVTLAFTLKDISGGGIAMLDEKKLLDNTIGNIYRNCRIDLPGASPLVCMLEIRSSQDLQLSSGKSIRKLGCRFVDLPNAMAATIQRYITGLERERNARATGLN